jgi:hypothetical protein
VIQRLTSSCPRAPSGPSMSLNIIYPISWWMSVTRWKVKKDSTTILLHPKELHSLRFLPFRQPFLPPSWQSLIFNEFETSLNKKSSQGMPSILTRQGQLPFWSVGSLLAYVYLCRLGVYAYMNIFRYTMKCSQDCLFCLETFLLRSYNSNF